MNTRKLVVLFTALLVIVRSVILMRREEYRLFPLWYLFFLVGSTGMARGIRRFLDSDETLLAAGKYRGHAWYQDLGVGFLWATIAIVCCVAYVEQKKPNQPVQHNAGSRPTSDDSSASETPSSLGPRG